METGLNWRHPEPAECPAPQSTCPRLGAGSAWASSWRLEARPSSRERLGGRTLALVTPPEALTTGHPLSPFCGLFMGKRKRSLLNSEVLLVSEHVPLGTAGGRLVGQSRFPQELRTEPRDSKATTEVYCLCPLMWSGRCFKCYGFSQTEWRCFCETHSQGFLFQWGYHTVIARHVRGWTGITFAESPGCHWQH